MSVHHLKVIQPYYDQLYLGLKHFELRRFDRDYKVGDILVLQEYDPNTSQFSGSNIEKQVTMVLSNCAHFGLMDGYCIMSIVDYNPFPTSH